MNKDKQPGEAGFHNSWNLPEHLNAESLYCVMIHNDDTTPFQYVVVLLSVIFELSDELAEHIAYMAHNQGRAPVLTCSRWEAEMMVLKAHTTARLDNYPLSFSLEPEPEELRW